MTEEEDRLKIVGDYKHGSICRVRLTNFLTYSEVEFCPGPRLNMVVGPNGTGKSTILCALCLGLGGEPKLLGRASEIETFVMNGEDEGEIEIEVANSNGKNPIVRRVIRRTGSPKSSFFWNDKSVTGKLVRETCLEKYHITVENLCTFLPQDRVGSFSGFDSKQLLIETEKSLSANQQLFHTHQELIEDQIALQGSGNKVETLKEKLDQLKVENQRLEVQKRRMQEREVALQQAELLRKKLVWLRFDEARNEATSQKEARQNLKQQLKEAAEKLKPLEDRHTEILKKLKNSSKEYENLNKEIGQHRTEMEKQAKKYESHDDSIETLLQELSAMDSHRAQLQSKVEQQRMKVSELQQTLEEYPSVAEYKQKELDARNQYKACLPEYDAAKRELKQIQDDLREVDEEHKRAADKWKKLQDEKARRRERIFRQHSNLQVSYEWLQSNRNKFRKEVVGPIMCEISPKSRNAAAYLEHHVPNYLLKAFVVQCKEDYDFLYNSIRRDRDIPIHIVNIERVEESPRQYSEQKMGVLKREHGVIGYMDESFTAPDVVVQALKNVSRVDKVLVGTEKTQVSLNDKNLLEYLNEAENGTGRLVGCCVFSCEGDRSYQYTSSISSYSKKAFLRVDDVKPAKFLAPGVSDDEKEKVQQDLVNLEGRKAELRPALESAETKLAETQEKAQSTLERAKKAKETLQDIHKLITKVKNAERKLKEAEEELSKDDEAEKKQKVVGLKKRIRHSSLALDAQSESHQKMMTATVRFAGIRLNREVVGSEERKVCAEKEEAARGLMDSERSFSQANQAFKDAKKKMHAFKQEADDIAPLYDSDGNELPLKAELEDLPVETMEEAEMALEEAETKANSIVADPNVIRQYEERKREIEGLQTELDSLTSSKEERIRDLEYKVKPWEERLKNYVSKIDILFSKYMSEIGCTGEVALVKGDLSDEFPHGDFKEWGIEIRVSFRENAKAQVLSARVQSGGERSVSTIMYLMALQDMMIAPFRCVDEINQGLDDRNERLVFRRIVENSTKVPGKGGPTDHSGQYFLITPKLLPNLYDMEVEAITVLCIFNGPFNFKDPRDWDVPKLLQLRKRAIAQTVAADDEENTPNSQPSENASTRSKRLRVSNASSIGTEEQS